MSFRRCFVWKQRVNIRCELYFAKCHYRPTVNLFSIFAPLRYPLRKAKKPISVGKSIKLFYRPKNLAGDSLSAQRNLQIKADAKGLKISNPTPYYVSFIDIKVAGKRLPLEVAEEKMLPPFGSHTWSTNILKGKVEWVTIDDHGGLHAFSQTL